MAKSTFEFFQLRCFVAVAEELNFRRAAERLNMTQPPLSRQIKLLEHALDETLFERNNRMVRLTPAGENFLGSASDILTRAERAVFLARQASRGDAGDVAIGFVPSAGIEFIPRIVTALREALPQVTFKPTEMMSYEIIESLISGRLDMGLTRTARRHPEIEHIRVVNEPFVLAVPAEHPLAKTRSAKLTDLNDEAFIGYSADRGGFLREQLAAVFANEDIEPAVALEVSQTMSVLALVNHGLGLALVPRSAQAIKMDGLVYREVEQPAQLRSTLYLGTAPKKRDTPMFQKVSEAIAKTLAPFR